MSLYMLDQVEGLWTSGSEALLWIVAAIFSKTNPIINPINLNSPQKNNLFSKWHKVRAPQLTLALALSLGRQITLVVAYARVVMVGAL